MRKNILLPLVGILAWLIAATAAANPIWGGGSGIFNNPSKQDKELEEDETSNEISFHEEEKAVPIGDGAGILLLLASGYLAVKIRRHARKAKS